LVLRILVVGFALTLLAGYVGFAQLIKNRRAAGSSKSTRILEDLRIIDGAIDQYAIETGRKPAGSADLQLPKDVAFPSSKSGGVLRLGDIRLQIPAEASTRPQLDLDTRHTSAPGSKSLVPVIDSKDLNVLPLHLPVPAPQQEPKSK
jgi:hypothetical protein